MGPAILARSGLQFAAKVHGSALEYTVKPNLERFGPYAREGVEAAASILVGSRHTAECLWTASCLGWRFAVCQQERPRFRPLGR